MGSQRVHLSINTNVLETQVFCSTPETVEKEEKHNTTTLRELVRRSTGRVGLGEHLFSVAAVDG